MKRQTNRMFFRCWGIVSLLLMGAIAKAQGVRTSQVLTLQVVELSRIELTVKALTLTIDKVQEESLEPAPVINAATKLVWTSNGENRKITIVSNNASPRYTLKAEAMDLREGSGTSTGEITLSDNATRDFIRDISRSSGECVVRFVASASVQQGTGTETFLITYTITSS